MSTIETTSWRTLPPEIESRELAAWVPRIARPVAITGATGFVGSHLAEALVSGGVRPRVLVREASRLLPALAAACDVITGGLEDAAAIERLVAGCGTLFHLAGRLRAPRREDFDRTNRVATAALVGALERRAPASRLVYVSSLAAAGPSADPAGKRPDDEPSPLSAYGASKLGGERAVRGFRGPWAIVRPPTIYGPRDIDVLQFFRLVSLGVVPLLAGERWVSVAHVGDVVRAVLAAATGDATGRVLHIGEPEPYEMRRLIALLAETGGRRARVVRVPGVALRLAGLGGDLLQRLGFRDVALTSDKARELLARHWCAQTAPSLRLLGVAGFVPFCQGALATWAWYRASGWLPHAKMNQYERRAKAGGQGLR